MTFLYPNVLYALILPALLAAAAWWLWRRRSRKWEVLVSPEYRRELVHAPATWHRVLPVIFAVLASIFAILSMARPVDGYTEVKEIPKSRNILIAIDCSRSMLSKDASPTRLGRAKTAAYDLLDALPGDNFGISVGPVTAIITYSTTSTTGYDFWYRASDRFALNDVALVGVVLVPAPKVYRVTIRAPSGRI